MQLHKDNIAFQQIIDAIRQDIKIEPALIEKITL